MKNAPPHTRHPAGSPTMVRQPARVTRILWLALIWGLGLLPVVSALTSPRIFGEEYNQTLQAEAQAPGGLLRLAGLFTTLLTLSIGAAALSAGLTRRHLPRAGGVLWASAMLLSAGQLLASRFGSHPHFTPGLLALPVVFSAAYLLPAVDAAWVSTQVRRVLLVYAYGSLLSALLAPDWAIETGYKNTFIPGFTFRLHGLSPHANNLAPLLLFYIVLDWFQPRKRTPLNVLNGLAVFLTLVLTQSKTVWLILVLLAVARSARRFLARVGNLRFAFVALGGAVMFGLVSVAMTGDWKHLLRSLSIRQSASLFTLTGRTLVWYYTVKVWSANPWFGYGPDLWNVDMRLSYTKLLGWAPPHAHNQFFESLGEAGIIGVVGLVCYTIVLLTAATKSRDKIAGTALLLASALLLRSLSEPFFRATISDGNFYLHFAVFALVLLCLKETRTEAAPPARVRTAAVLVPAEQPS